MDSKPLRTCFVTQPFNERYDKLYADVIEPAVVAARFRPYRVDRDPGVQIPIEAIESKIRAASAVLVEISENNPNVWFELGLARAAHRPTVLLCEAAKREKLPFNIQHRTTLFYKTESLSDFERLSTRITEHLQAMPAGELPSTVAVTLSSMALRVLIAVANAEAYYPNVPMTRIISELPDDVRRHAVGPALAALMALDLVERTTAADPSNFGDEYHAYRLTGTGLKRVALEAADPL